MGSWNFVDFDYLLTGETGETREFIMEATQHEIDSIVRIQGYHPDVATDMRTLLLKYHADFKLCSHAIIDLFSKLAVKFPDVSFAIRGRGELIQDIWLREYAGGKNTVALGPPEDYGY